MGIMAVAPRNPVMGDVGVRAPGLQGSGPPGDYGGNMDFRALTVGATLYLPVFHSGARFYMGDPHGAQGDGEVSGNALEQSLTGVFRFVVHKGKTIAAPRAENATHYIVMGIDVDLDRSMKLAVAEAVKFLVDEKGTHAGQGVVALQHRRRLPRGGSGRRPSGRGGKIPKSMFLKN